MSIFGGIGSVVGADIIAYVKLSGADTFNRDLDKINQNATLFAGALNKTMNVALGAGAAAFLASSAAAITFESSFAGVLKTTDGLTDSLGNINAEGVALSQEFRKLALEIPVSVNELNRIGELGGQLGIAKGDLITFTEVIAKLGATTDLSYEQGATAIAQFVNVTKTVVPAGISVQSQIERIASTLVDLGNKSVATESGILEFAQRLAGAGATVGLTQEQILSLGAALSSVGLNAEMGGTAFSRLLLNMKTAVEKGSSSLEVFSRVAGVDFKEAFETDAAGAITKFIEGMHSISKSGGSVINVLGELGINEARMTSALLLASNAGELLNKTFEIGEAAYRSNTALSDEFAKRTATTSAQLTLLKNSVVDGAIELGQTFLPAINSVLGSLNKSPETVKAFISSFGQVAVLAAGLAGLYKVGTGLVTLVTSMNPLVLTLTGIAAGITAILTLVKSNELKKLAKIEGVSDSVKQLITLSEQYKELYETKNKSIEQNELLSETNNQLLEIFRATVGPVKEIGGNIDILTRRALEFKRENLSMAMSMLGKRIEGLNVQALNKNFQASQTTIKQLNQQYDLMDEELKQVNMMLAVHSANVEGNTQKVATNEVQIAATKEELKKYHEELTNGVEFLGEVLTANIQMTDGIAKAKNAIDLGTQSFIGMNAETVNAKNHSIGLSTVTTELNGQVRTLGDGLNLSTEELKKQAKETAISRERWSEYSQLIHTITSDMGPLGDVINIVTDSFVSASSKVEAGKMSFSALLSNLDPLTLGLNLASFAFGLFGEEEEKIVYTTEEVIDRVYGADSAMAEFINTIDNLSLEMGQYDFIDAATEKFKLLEEQLTFAYNRYGSMSLQVKLASDALEAQRLIIEGLTTSFEFLDQELLTQSTYLTENIVKALEYYGNTIPLDKAQTWLALLGENTAKLQEQSGLLAVGSQAWKDNEAAINANNYIIGLLSGTWSDFGGYVASANLDIEAASRFLAKMGLEGEDLDNALLELGFTTKGLVVATEPALDIFHQFMFELSYCNDEMERSKMLQDELVNAGIETTDSVRQQILYWETLLSTLEVGSYEYRQVTDKLNVLYGKLGETSPWEEQKRAVESLTAAIEPALDRFHQFMFELSYCNDELERSKMIQGELVDAGIETIDSVRQQILYWETLIETLEVGSYEYEQVADKLDGLYDKLGETSPWITQEKAMKNATDAAMKAAEAMAAVMGIETVVRTPVYDDAGNVIGYSTGGTTSGGGGGGGGSAQRVLSDVLSSSGIETIQSITDQIEALEELQTQVGYNSAEYVQITNKINEMNRSLIDANTAINDFTASWEENLNSMFSKYDQFERDTKNVQSALEELSYFGIGLDETTVDEQIGFAIKRMQDFLATLDPDSAAFADAQATLDALMAQFLAMGGVIADSAPDIIGTPTTPTYADTGGGGGGGGAVNPFQTWNDMVNEIIENLRSGGTFEQAAIDAANVINDLLTFKVDLDTTEADEGIQALIQSWSAYLVTLSPDSPGYKAASDAFYALLLKYAALGTPISFNVNGSINIPPLSDSQLRSLYAIYVLNKSNSGSGYLNYTYWKRAYDQGELLLHTGGMLGGLSSGSYGSIKEIPFTGLEGEYVMNPNIGRKFGEAALDAFNVSGNPAVLGGGMAQQQVPSIEFKPEVVINNAAPETFVTWTDKYIHPRIRDNDDRQIKSDRFK